MNVKGLLVLFLVFAAFFFFPTTVLANQPECLLSDGAAGRCWSAPRQGELAQSGSGQLIFLPNITVQEDARGTAQSAAEAAPQEAAASADGEGIPNTGAGEGGYHTVQPAENLVKIARLYDTPLEALLLANPKIANPALIYVGDRLRIPSADEIERLVSEEALRRIQAQQQVVASAPHNGQRWIDVDLRTQTVRAYEGDRLVNTFTVSTGRPNTPTVTGQYRIWVKLRTDDMRGPGYDLKDVPYVMYFYKGYGLHGTYWHNNFGTPMSHGCVNLSTEDAAWLFDFASVGTLVNVH